jgi:hypothetical protein
MVHDEDSLLWREEGGLTTVFLRQAANGEVSSLTPAWPRYLPFAGS